VEEISSSPTSQVAWLTPGDRKPQEQGSGVRASKAKPAAAAPRVTPKSAGDHIEELAAPEIEERHELDEIA
jgi:hypothetical protein